MFAVGLLLYKMLSGTLPHGGATPGEIVAALFRGDLTPLAVRVPAMPEGVTRLVDRCLAAAPEQRFPDASALLAAIEPLLMGLGSSPAGVQMTSPWHGGSYDCAMPTTRELPPVVAGTTQPGTQTGGMLAGRAPPGTPYASGPYASGGYAAAGSHAGHVHAGYTHGPSLPPHGAPGPARSLHGAIFALAFIVPIAIAALLAAGGLLFYIQGRSSVLPAAATPSPPTSAASSPAVPASSPAPAGLATPTGKVVAGAKAGAPSAPATAPAGAAAPSASPPAVRRATSPVLGAWAHNTFRSEPDRAPDLAAFRRAEPGISACLQSANLSPCEGLVDPNMNVEVTLSLDASGNVIAVSVGSLGCSIDGRFKSIADEPYRGCVSTAARSVKLGPPREGVSVSAGFKARIGWR